MKEPAVIGNGKWLQIKSETLGKIIINVDEIRLVLEDSYLSDSKYMIYVKLKNDKQELVYQTKSEEDHEKVFKEIGAALGLYAAPLNWVYPVPPLHKKSEELTLDYYPYKT